MQELGLTTVDDEYEKALEDAAQCRSGHQLRQLFAHLLIHCEVSKPADLFDKFCTRTWLKIICIVVETQNKICKIMPDAFVKYPTHFVEQQTKISE